MTLRIHSFDDYLKHRDSCHADPSRFWLGMASQFDWFQEPTRGLSGSLGEGNVTWFGDGKVNIVHNALDRHLEHRGDKTAIVWEPNDPAADVQRLTYAELHARVSEFGAALKQRGVSKGDRVVLYMPMTVELGVATLACARIGAVHSVVFAGFSAQALRDRIQDASAKVVITANESVRGNKVIPLKPVVDEALVECPSVTDVVVQKVTGTESAMEAGRDVWMDEFLATSKGASCPAEPMDAEDPLFILYTSGSTGKPKGVVHSHGGYMVYTAYSFTNVFQYDDNDVYWCTADIGWITGHSYILYGPLLSGATSLMFEGVPTFPSPGRFWEVCEKHKVNQFYTAPTAIRALMAHGNEHVERHDLSSLKVLGSVGEPINTEAWTWYHEVVGQKRCPIVDTWWQTETGGIMLSGLGGLHPQKAGHAGLPLPGIQPVLVDAQGAKLEGSNEEGLLCIEAPWPSMIRTTYGDHERFLNTYLRPFPGHYFTGDAAKRDEDGLYRVIGRVDDVINVSGHRLGTAEIESAINEAQSVVESAVVGFEHPIKGQGIYAFVICDQSDLENEGRTKSDIEQAVLEGIGKIARPDKIQIVPGLPKTRSGKIMRRILRKIASGETENFGDTSTLLDPHVVTAILEKAQ